MIGLRSSLFDGRNARLPAIPISQHRPPDETSVTSLNERSPFVLYPLALYTGGGWRAVSVHAEHPQQAISTLH
jgi:hypothetical protein